MKQLTQTRQKKWISILLLLLPIMILYIACKQHSSAPVAQDDSDSRNGATTQAVPKDQRTDSSDAWSGLYGIRGGDSTYDHRYLTDSSGADNRSWRMTGAPDSLAAGPEATQALTGNWAYYYGAKTKPDSGKSNEKQRKP